MRTTVLALAFVAGTLVTSSIATLAAQELVFTTENDIFADDDALDDLYTFAVALELRRAGLDFSLRESAFTDRAAGVRFDETAWSVGRELPAWHSWRTYAEVGAVRVGRGIFGQEVQNTVHRAIGNDPVELDYLDPSLHGRLSFAGERSRALGERFSAGPRLELEWITALHSHALVAVQVQWRPHPVVDLDLLAGGRWSAAGLAALAPHVESFGAAVRLGVTAYDRLRFAWTYNDRGDGRSHLAIGYRFANWKPGEIERLRR